LSKEKPKEASECKPRVLHNHHHQQDSKRIILRVQENLLPPTFTGPNIPLHRPHSPRNIRPHPRRPTDKDRRARSRPALAAQLAQHERDVRTAPFRGPAGGSGFARQSGGHESEAHEVLLKFGWCRREAEVGVLGILLVVLLDCIWVVWCVGVGRRGDSLEGVEGGVLRGRDVEA
jgi:hypothetical protein